MRICRMRCGVRSAAWRSADPSCHAYAISVSPVLIDVGNLAQRPALGIDDHDRAGDDVDREILQRRAFVLRLVLDLHQGRAPVAESGGDMMAGDGAR
jgi:hypothetical protein